jgi:hypothetical protein
MPPLPGLRPVFTAGARIVDGRSKRIDYVRSQPQHCPWCVQASGKINHRTNRKISRKPGRCPPIWTVADEDLQEHLFQLVREDGQVDTDELQIVARRGGGLFGKSRAERHRMLLSIDRRRGNSGNCRLWRFSDSHGSAVSDQRTSQHRTFNRERVLIRSPTAVRKIRCSATRRESHTSRR